MKKVAIILLCVALIFQSMSYVYAAEMPESDFWIYNPTKNWWYYIDEDGNYTLGWMQDKNENWYFFGEGYIMQSGYTYLDGKWFYFTAKDNEKSGKLKGQMYVNETTPDGREADENGELSE